MMPFICDAFADTFTPRMLVVAGMKGKLIFRVQIIPLPKTLKSESESNLADGSMRHLLLRLLLVMATN